MKYIFLFCILLFSFLSIIDAQTIDWDSVRADYVKKYQPQQMPAWLFPIIFEEGNGERDTIYLGYDPSAQDFGIGGNSDTIFGEDWMIIDTTKFNAMWGGGIFNGDSIYKNLIVKSLNANISFFKGILPLKMYWNKDAFHNPALPFPDQSPAPRAEGLLVFDYPMGLWGDSAHTVYCPIGWPLLLTDTVKPFAGCYKSESLEFFSQISDPDVPPSYLQFSIRAWTGRVVGIEDPDDMKVNIYPNPASSHITIDLEFSTYVELELLDITGKRIIQVSSHAEKIEMPLESLPAGVYIIHIKIKNKYAYEKIIINKF